MAQLFPWLLPQASSVAPGIDFVYWLITAVCFAFFVGVSFFLCFFIIRYRQGTKVSRVLPHHEGIALEMIWTIIPLIIALGLFLVSTLVYFQTVRAPKDATEIFVVGKQWMWKIQHPNGRWEMNEIHVPVGHPVKLTMISEDVIHDFGMPAFRLNMDVVPGKYTQTWFTPTRVGRYHIFCAQYCGTNHAIMGGYVTVMEPGQFEKWMQTGNVRSTTASEGERLFRDNGCTGCHGPNSNVRAPSLNGVFGKYRPVQVPGDRAWSKEMAATMVKADYRYLHDAIWTPAKEVAAGYKPIMPSFAGRLNEEEVLQIIDYIKTLQTSNGTSNGSAEGYDPGKVQNNNAIGLSDIGDARTGKLYGGSPTGDMSNGLDREATLTAPFEIGKPGDAATGKLYGGSPTGDMANGRDRESIFRGGGAASSLGTTDRSAGGLRNQNQGKRGGLNVYNSDSYIKSQTKDITGGLKSQVPAGASSDQY
ncbi:cytochrome c oxidase subunit II [bacterium]|nr:MAG: cytochrome c oxidase subunit II [bacterium]